MKTKKTLLISLVLLSASMLLNAQGTLNFLTTGSCASYIQWHNSNSLTADSIYSIQKAKSLIAVDGVAEAGWDIANPMVIANIAHNGAEAVNLNKYPQTEAYAHATFKALWTADGVYMYIRVLDNNIVYQNFQNQWENDGIEFYFSKTRGSGKIQVIIPAMVGLTNPTKPAALDFESGSARGSDIDYKILGYDATNWDETTFNWAIKKTAVGYDMEVYMDKDIVTNGNSATNFGLNKIFTGDINLNLAGTLKNTNVVPTFIREGTLALLGNSNQGYANSNNYGYFKLVEGNTAVKSVNDIQFKAIYNSASKEIKISSNEKALVTVSNIAGQIMPITYNSETISVSKLKQGIYIVKAVGINGNNMGTQKLVIY